jgi:type I restriction enzyme, S subunit
MSWPRARLKNLCLDAGQYGLNVSSTQYSETGIRLVRTSDISENGSLRPPENGVFVDLKLDDRFLLAEGDLLLSRSGTLGRSLLVPPLDASRLTFAGYLVRFRPLSDVDSRFLRYVAASSSFQSAIEAGAVESTIQNFNAERYANIDLPCPPLDEQRRIADFLDAETTRIDHVDGLRRQQLTVLDERLVAAVDRVFDSFVDAVPTHLKFLLCQRPRYGVLVPDFVDDGVPFVRVNDLLDLPGRLDHLRKIPRAQSKQYARTIIHEGDILLSVVGTLGRVAIAPRKLAGANIARAVSSLRVRPDVQQELVAAWTVTTSFKRQAILATGTDTAQPTLGMEDLANFGLRWPTDPAEQRAGLAAVQASMTAIGAAQRALSRQRALLSERRKALVTAAVTGQFDVTTGRGAELS